MKNTYLITGVAGFIGSSIAKRLINEGRKVIGIDDLSTGKKENVPYGVEFIEADLVTYNLSNINGEEIDVIMHLAGQSSGEISFADPVRDLELNTISTLRLAKFAREQDIRRMMYASSMAVYGEKDKDPVEENVDLKPISCYGIGKAAAESYLRILLGKRAVFLRMFNVYGGGQDLENMRQGMVSIFVSQFLNQERVVVKGSLNRFRDFIFIDDVVDVWESIAKQKHIDGPINVCTGRRTTVKELLNELELLLGEREIVQEGGTPGDQSGIFGDDTQVKMFRKKEKWTDLGTGLSKMLAEIGALN